MIPDYLLDILKKYYDESDLIDITNSYSRNKYSSIRVNTIKSNVDEVVGYLSSDYELISEIPNAIVINEDLRDSSLYNEGKIYYQSLSSQIPPFIVDPKENEMILDMTAAPGGKTTEMAALSGNKAMITAIEKNKIRFDRLSYNISKQGAKRVTVLQCDARSLDEYFMFDKILLDAPCSGSGTIINSDYSKISKELIDRCISTQRLLIREAIKHLKVGGELVYSTCSIIKDENELIIKELLDEYSNLEIVPIELNLINKLPSIIDGVITIKPNDFYEGFFVCKLKKIS